MDKKEYRERLKGKTVAVIGLGVSGEGVLSALEKLGANALVADRKEVSLPYGRYLPLEDFQTENVDLAVISPGVPLTSREAKVFLDRGIPVIGEIEFAYRIGNFDFVCISGTNGKTTTTSLCGEIFKRHCSAEVAGNIGIAAAPFAFTDTDVLVTEISSFQIESFSEFHPLIAAILNITPDHLDRHGTFEAYAELKLDLLRRSDIRIVNAECPVLSEHAAEFPDAYRFSHLKKVERGAYVEDGKIYVKGIAPSFRENGRIPENGVCEAEYVCDLSDSLLMGSHNVENVLAAVLISRIYGIPSEIVREAVRAFRAVEHRIEYVRTVRGVRFYNDSKGTNPDSTIKAIEAMDAPCHLIAGGYEKHSDFTEMLRIGRGKVASLSLLGVTANRISARAQELGYDCERIRIFDTLREATENAYANAKDGEIVLLSPASASWGMYANFEERGKDFKACVNTIKE